MAMTKETHAIIMAGGEGKRMNSDLPKVLHCVVDEEMIVSIIRKVSTLDVKTIYVVCGRHIDNIKNCIKNRLINEHELFNNLVFVNQKVPLGTGDAVKQCLPYLVDKDVNVLILNGDTPLIDMTLHSFATKPVPSLMVTHLDNPYGQGRIVVDDYGNFKRIVEEKDASFEEKQIKLVNCGVYHVSSKQLNDYIPLIDDNNVQKEYYLTDLCKFIQNEMNLFVVPNELQYELLNVNTQKDLMEARKMMIVKALWKNNIVIRKLEKDDYQKGYLDLLCDLSDTITDKSEESFNIVFENIISNPNHHVYVLEDVTKNMIIGNATLLVEPKFIHNGRNVGHIEDVVVTKKVQSRGLGKSLILYLTTLMNETGCYKLILDCNDKVQVFYSKCGFSSKAIQMSLYS